MTEELKPCPFCGGKAELTERHNEGYSVYGRFWYTVECIECGTRFFDREEFDSDGKLKFPAKECISKWNIRPCEDALETENNRLRVSLRWYAENGHITNRVINGNCVAKRDSYKIAHNALEGNDYDQ